MSRTYTQLRQLTAQQLGLVVPGGYISGTADTGGTTSQLKDSILQLHNDDSLIGAWILLTSGTPSDTDLLVTDSGQSGGTATFRPTLGAAPDALTYDILPYSPTEFLRAVQDAILRLYDSGLLVHETWVRAVGNSPLYNADFSAWTSATVADGWSRNSTGTIARERASGNIALSDTSLKLSTAADYVKLDAKWKRFIWDKKGYSVRLYCWVKASNTSHARIALYDGTTINYSAYHGGGGDWELLNVEVAIGETATDIEPRLYNDSTNAVYFNMPALNGGPAAREYPVSLVVLPDGPTQVRIAPPPNNDWSSIASQRGFAELRQQRRQLGVSDFSFLRFHDEGASTELGVLDFTASRRVPRDDQLLWLIGSGPLTVPTAEADIIEVTQSQSLLIATLAAVILLERHMPRAPSPEQRLLAERAARLSRQYAELAGGAGRTREAAALPMRW